MNPSDSEALELPVAYEPLALDDGANVRAATLSLAATGAGEGTLVWATRQAQGEGRPGKTWYAPDQGLYLSLILEPEFEPEQAGQIALVGLVAMGLALAEQVMPMTDLSYRWPNDILLSGAKVAGLWLDRDVEEGWLVLNLAVNVGTEPEQVVDAGCVQIEGGNPDITPQSLLQDFARQFLHWINRWDEEGLEPLLAQFRLRHAAQGTPLMLRLDSGEAVAGAFCGLSSEGGVQIDAAGQTRTLSLNEFFGL